MILNKMTPDVVYKRTLIIDVMYQMPVALIEQVIERDKLPGDYIESFFEEDGTETKRLNFEWLLFKATNYQLEAIVKRIIPVKKPKEETEITAKTKGESFVEDEMKKQREEFPKQMAEIALEGEIIRSGYLQAEEETSTAMPDSSHLKAVKD